MLGSFQAIGQAPLLQLSDLLIEGDNEDVVGTNVSPRLGRLYAQESVKSLLSFTGGCEYTLGDLALSSTNIWLNAFTIIACFPFLNMQGKSQRSLHVTYSCSPS